MADEPDVYCDSCVPGYRVEGAGPLLVYIPGLDGTGEMLFKQMSGLARSYRVVTFRLRDGGRFTYEDLADDVAAIIKDTGERRATVLTESFGGGVALTFALRYPLMLERLVLVNSFPRYRRRIRIRLGARLASIVPFRLIWPVRKAADRVGLLVDDVTGEDRRRFFEIIRTVKREGYARRLRLIAELDLDGRLSEIEAPVLIIATEKDMLVPSIVEARKMAARMPRATVKIIKGAGHACLLGNRVCLADILDEWQVAVTC